MPPARGSLGGATPPRHRARAPRGRRPLDVSQCLWRHRCLNDRFATCGLSAAGASTGQAFNGVVGRRSPARAPREHGPPGGSPGVTASQAAPGPRLKTPKPRFCVPSSFGSGGGSIDLGRPSASPWGGVVAVASPGRASSGFFLAFLHMTSPRVIAVRRVPRYTPNAKQRVGAL